MKKYLYSLRTDLVFSKPVKRHTFLLKAVPAHVAGQEPMRVSLTCSPNTALSKVKDFAGNVVYQGYLEHEHDTFVFCSTGEVALDKTRRSVEEPQPYYFLSSRLTRLQGDMYDYFQEHCTEGSVANRVADWMNCLVCDFKYATGMTTTATSASEAWSIGSGVCQDFSHILMTFLRAQKIACRYVAGLMAGEGASHAWVEYYDGKAWVGVDPTHRCEVGDGYMKISHGIDFDSCCLEKGVFIGDATQTVTSKCALIEI